MAREIVLTSLRVGICARCGCGRVLELFSAEDEVDHDEYSRRYAEELRTGKAADCWRVFQENLPASLGATAKEGSRSVLDVGCGEGAFLDLAQTTDWTTAGLEITPAAAKAARAKGHEIHCQSIEERGLEDDNRFDAVVLWDVLEHLEKPHRALLHSRDALAPDGTLMVLTPRMGSAFDRVGLLLFRLTGGRFRALLEMCWSHDHLFRFDAEGLRRALEQLGFQDVTARPLLLLSLRPENYAGGGILRSWTGIRGLDRLISRLGVATVKLLRLHNKVLVIARRRPA